MAMRKEDLYKLIDQVPEGKYYELEQLIKKMTIPEAKATIEEIEAIEKARKEFENGETSRYTIEELRREFLGNE